MLLNEESPSAQVIVVIPEDSTIFMICQIAVASEEASGALPTYVVPVVDSSILIEV
jgi:hypothetical protein